MTIGLTARIRLVKCPRCHRLLPELPGIPVYKCGGCDAILLAKNRTNDSDDTGLGSPNKDSAQSDEFNPHSEDKQIRNANESVESNNEEQRNARSARNDDESTSDGDKADEASISSSSHEPILPSSGECVIDPDIDKEQDESGDYSTEQLVRNNFDDEKQSDSRVDEFASQENVELSGLDSLKSTEIRSSIHEVLTIPFSSETVLDPNDEEDRKEDEDNHQKQPVQISSIKHGKSASIDDEQSGSSYRVSFANEVADRENYKLSSGDDSEEDEINNDTKEIHFNLEISGIIPSKILVPLEERIDEHEETNSPDFDGRVPVEMNHCIEPGIIKSAYDGMNDQFLNHQIHSLNNIHEAADVLAAAECSRTDESLTNSNAVARDSETPVEANRYWKSLPHENNMLQYRKHDVQNRSTLRREKYQKKLPLLERDCQGDYENGNIYSSMFDEPHDPRMHPSDNFMEHDEEKVRLLRMVYELQDELAKSCNVNGNASGSVSTGSTRKDTWVPMYQIPQEGSWHDPEYSSYSLSRARTSYPGQHSLSRMTSSANVVNDPRVNYYGMEHFRGESIPHSMHQHNRGARMAYLDHDYYSQYNSCASSPQHFLSTQLSARGIRMQSDHMYHDNERNYLRENNHLAKLHLRPMAGGAPFVTCYYCSKLLQIPAEFLLVKRRCNRLKCGHCSKVLEFSLQSRTHIVPYVRSVAKPPPYELDDHTLAIGKNGCREIDDSIVLPRSSRQELVKELSSKWLRNKANKLSSDSTKSNSPLHRLMGYSSPSQVFRGLNASRRSMQRKN